MATQTEVVQKLTAVPCLLLLPSRQLPLRTLRCSRPGLLQSWTTLSRIGHSTTQHLPLWIFSWSGIQHSLASPNTSTLLSNWVLGCLQVIRWYLIVCRATLVRAVSSCVSGEAIFRINSFTEYKRSGLSMPCPVRRSSSSLTPSGGSCQFAVPRNSLIWLASGPPTSSIPGLGQSQSFQVCGDRTWPEVAKLLGALAEVPLTRVFGSGKARQESRRRQTLESSRSDRQETARMASET